MNNIHAQWKKEQVQDTISLILTVFSLKLRDDISLQKLSESYQP